MSESDPLPGVQPPAKKPHGRPPAFDPTVYSALRLLGYKPQQACKIAGSDMKGRALQEQALRMEKHASVVKEMARLRGSDGALEAVVDTRWPKIWTLCQAKLIALLQDPNASDSNALQAIKLIGELTGHLKGDGGQINVVTVAHVDEARERILELQADPDVQRAALKRLERLTSHNDKGK